MNIIKKILSFFYFYYAFMGIASVINRKRKTNSYSNEHIYAIIIASMGHSAFYSGFVLIEIKNIFEVDISNTIFKIFYFSIVIFFVILNMWIFKKNYRFLYKKYSQKKWNLIKTFLMILIPPIICLYHIYLRA